MGAILKHELRTYFHSLTAYMFCAILLLIVGIGSLLYNIQSSVANFEYVLQFTALGLAILIPILTMRILSEEKKLKTDQLLYSLPLKTTQIVIGKYLSMLIIFAIPMAIMCIYPLMFSMYGDVYLPTSFGAIIAFFIMGAAFIAIGTFISSLTDNLGFAAGVSIGLLVLNYFSVTLASYVSVTALGSMIAFLAIVIVIALIAYALTKNGNFAYIVAIVGIVILIVIFLLDSSLLENLLPTIMSGISLFSRFNTFVNGVFEINSIVFYVSVIALFLFLTVQSLEKRRYN